MFKDPGNQSYLWSGFSGLLAWLGDQNNLMLISIAIGIVTALVNAYSKCSEGRMLKREDERKEENDTRTQTLDKKTKETTLRELTTHQEEVYCYVNNMSR